MRHALMLGVTSVWAAAAGAARHEPELTLEPTEDPTLESQADEVIVIVDPLPRAAASEETITREELRLRPRRTPGQLLGAAPGLFVGQHAGGGKADQLFLRGFDADHGTDVAIFVDGVPVNQGSHAHGQGYADLHFVIPELIDHIHVGKGPYTPDAGDFATAGTVRLFSTRRLEDDFVTVGAGSFDTLRLVGATGAAEGALSGWIAGELHASDGPFDAAQGLRRHNLMARATVELGPLSEAWLAATTYGGGWDASGQIPLREVVAGRLSRFGAIDPTEGGLSARSGVQLGVRAGGDPGLELRAYAVRYRLDLFSNFTFVLDDPVHGDGIEQVDRRTTYGLVGASSLRRRVGPVELVARLGADSRADDAEVALWSQVARARLGLKNRALVAQQSQGAWAELQVGRDDGWHLAAGARADLFGWQVDGAEGTARNGVARRAIANPKLRADVRLVRAAAATLDLFLNGGGGFHSNDARDVVIGGDAPTLPRAWGGEVGARLRHRRGLYEVALAGWGLWLEREQVWIGDAGETELRGASRRAGVEASGRWRVLPWLGVEAEATWSHARFTDGGRVPLAPSLTVSAALTARHRLGVSGQLRARHLGDRPASEDASLTAEGFTVLDLVAAYRWRDLELELSVDNLTDAAWREAQFAFASRLPTEEAPVEDVHFTPGVPRSLRAALTYRF